MGVSSVISDVYIAFFSLGKVNRSSSEIVEVLSFGVTVITYSKISG